MVGHLRDGLTEFLGSPVRLFACNPVSLESVFAMFEELGKTLKLAEKGRSLAQKMKAQFMSWGDSFYDRSRNKRVTFLAGLSPLRVGGNWIPDLIGYASAVPQRPQRNLKTGEVTWEDIAAFRPDVIIVAPEGYTLDESKRSFMELEKLPGWEALPAVKRGEVFFTDGDTHFYKATPALMESGGLIISAVAGLDSGYITKRDSMFRLRFLEMNRHRL